MDTILLSFIKMSSYRKDQPPVRFTTLQYYKFPRHLEDAPLLNKMNFLRIFESFQFIYDNTECQEKNDSKHINYFEKQNTIMDNKGVE